MSCLGCTSSTVPGGEITSGDSPGSTALGEKPLRCKTSLQLPMPQQRFLGDKSIVKKTVLLYTVSMVVGLYTTFVLTILWGWFAVPAFGVGAISFWVMYGLTMLIELFRSHADIEADHRHKIVATMLDACVPTEKREEVTERLAEFSEQIWYEAGWTVFGQIITNTITLGVGFAVHLLAS